MQIARRAAMSGLLAALFAAAGCGGTDTTTDHGAFVDPASTDLKGGGSGSGTTSTSIKLAVAPAPVDRNSPLTISLYPGSYANQKLFIKWQCYQNGSMLAYDGSFDLAAAVSQGLAGYVFAGDHYDWTFVMSQAWNYNLVDGPASCYVQAWYENRKLQWFQIGSGTFGVQ